MNDAELKVAAEEFLRERNIGFVPSTSLLRRDGRGRAEVSYAVPDTLIPGAVVDPPDVRVSIDLHTRLVELIPQM